MEKKIKIPVSNSKICDVILYLINLNETEINYYAFTLIGDIAKVNKSCINMVFDQLMSFLIQNLECPININKNNNDDIYKLNICINCCWTIGILSIIYGNFSINYIEQIMGKLLKILCVPRINKLLAQNLSICIGRIGITNPEIVAKSLDCFLKQFCLSLRLINNSEDKQQAFTGLCQSILHNPNGIINHFAYFCDAICNYDNAPNELESMFQNLIYSYKKSLNDKWNSYFKEFPTKLQNKMIKRFSQN